MLGTKYLKLGPMPVRTIEYIRVPCGKYFMGIRTVEETERKDFCEGRIGIKKN